MIGWLSGRLAERGMDHIVIDVRGVGYVVYCSERTLMSLPGVGEPVALHTDLLVREDLLQLFGFLTRVEREWHRLLMSVQGIGAKASLAILGTLGADGVSRAIALGDQAAVRAAKGIGPKTALRVVNELKDKAPTVMAMASEEPGDALQAPGEVLDEQVSPKPNDAIARAPSGTGAAQSAALSALRNLGYDPQEAAAAVAEAASTAPDVGESELIRAALQLLAPKG